MRIPLGIAFSSRFGRNGRANRFVWPCLYNVLFGSRDKEEPLLDWLKQKLLLRADKGGLHLLQPE